MASAVVNPFRFAKVDFPAAWAYWPISTLLPYPKETIDLAACFKPLTYEVKKNYLLIDFTQFLLQILKTFEIILRKSITGVDYDCHISICYCAMH